jgi:hypothetical protein
MNRLLNSALRAEGETQVVVGLEAIRLEPRRLAELGDRFLYLPVVAQRISEDVVGFEKIRFKT